MRITKPLIALLAANIVYLCLFAVLYSMRENYEFLIYVGTVAFFVVLITLLHLKFGFSNGVLLGLSAWGLLHMLGGYIVVNARVLYAYQLIPGVLRFDQAVHTFGFGYATLLSYYILRPSLKVPVNWIAVSVLLVLVGMGIGALNETVEFIAVLSVPETGVGGYDNTMWDMVFNTIGAILAVVYVNLKRSMGR